MEGPGVTRCNWQGNIGEAAQTAWPTGGALDGHCCRGAWSMSRVFFLGPVGKDLRGEEHMHANIHTFWSGTLGLPYWVV
jgi:hypothetical protein